MSMLQPTTVLPRFSISQMTHLRLPKQPIPGSFNRHSIIPSKVLLTRPVSNITGPRDCIRRSVITKRVERMAIEPIINQSYPVLSHNPFSTIAQPTPSLTGTVQEQHHHHGHHSTIDGRVVVICQSLLKAELSKLASRRDKLATLPYNLQLEALGSPIASPSLALAMAKPESQAIARFLGVPLVSLSLLRLQMNDVIQLKSKPMGNPTSTPGVLTLLSEKKIHELLALRLVKAGATIVVFVDTDNSSSNHGSDSGLMNVVNRVDNDINELQLRRAREEKMAYTVKFMDGDSVTKWMDYWKGGKITGCKLEMVKTKSQSRRHTHISKRNQLDEGRHASAEENLLEEEESNEDEDTIGLDESDNVGSSPNIPNRGRRSIEKYQFGPMIDIDLIDGVMREKRLYGNINNKSPLIQAVLGQKNAVKATPSVVSGEDGVYSALIKAHLSDTTDTNVIETVGEKETLRTIVSSVSGKEKMLMGKEHGVLWAAQAADEKRSKDGLLLKSKKRTDRVPADIISPSIKKELVVEGNGRVNRTNALSDSNNNVVQISSAPNQSTIRILDCTAGFGTDSFVVASCVKAVREEIKRKQHNNQQELPMKDQEEGKGEHDVQHRNTEESMVSINNGNDGSNFSMTLLERNPVLFLLLADGLRRARQHEEVERVDAFAETIQPVFSQTKSGNMSNHPTSATKLLEKLETNATDLTPQEKHMAKLLQRQDEMERLRRNEVAKAADVALGLWSGGSDAVVTAGLRKHRSEAAAIALRLRVVFADAVDFMSTLHKANNRKYNEIDNDNEHAVVGADRLYDVVYLDPFYPTRATGADYKRKAALRNTKYMAFAKALRSIDEERLEQIGEKHSIHKHLMTQVDNLYLPTTIREPLNTKILVESARLVAGHRVVVKRPSFAPPSHDLIEIKFEDRNTRFDVIPPALGKKSISRAFSRLRSLKEQLIDSETQSDQLMKTN